MFIIDQYFVIYARTQLYDTHACRPHIHSAGAPLIADGSGWRVGPRTHDGKIGILLINCDAR